MKKDEQIIQALGTIDELNASLGLARSSLTDKKMQEIIKTVQEDLFTIAAEIGHVLEEVSPVSLQIDRIKEIERLTEAIHKQTGALEHFIFPGGSPSASLLHMSRTICRRAEREIVKLTNTYEIPPHILRYMNRLAGLLFSLARLTNKKEGKQEEQWNTAVMQE